jgi:hypothetical protein
MKKWFIGFLAILFILAADKQRAIDLGETTVAAATNCSVAPGSSSTTVNAMIVAAKNNSCTSTASATTVEVQVGYSAITSSIHFTCIGGQSPITFTGPQNADPTNLDVLATAGFTGPVVNGFGFTFDSCAQNVTFKNIEWDGERPNTCYPGCVSGNNSTATGGGGGGVYIAPGTSNLTFLYDNIHGNQGSPNGNAKNQLFWFDGYDTQTSGTATISNVEIGWSQIGSTSPQSTAGSGDCSNLMTAINYNGKNYDASTGADPGWCDGIGIHSHVNNVNIHNNRIWNQEQAVKQFDGSGNNPYYSFLENGLTLSENDVQWGHRNPFELQGRGQGAIGMTLDGNDMFNVTDPGNAGLMFSVPSCCGGSSVAGAPAITSPNLTNVINNLIMANTGNEPMGVEFWSQGTSSHNYIAGQVLNGIQWGFSSTPPSWSVNYNVMHLTGTSHNYIGKEEAYAVAPSQTGNVLDTTLATLVSQAPSISPASQSISSPITVTLTDAGLSSSTAGPSGHTSIYYTLNGSTPTTSSTFCGTGSCSLSVSPGATIKYIGMWGARNQPKSYPAGYGFTPSAVQTATYPTGAVTVTLSSVAITNVGGFTSLPIGGTNSFSAQCTYSDLTQTTCSGTADSHGNLAAFVSTNATVGSIDATTGVFTALTTGNTLVTASVNGMLATTGTTVAVQSIENALTNWLSVCYIGSCGGGSPGGTNAPASTQQTVNNASPAGAPSGTSMLLSQTTLTTSTQTNVLWRYQAVSTCDLCTVFSTSSSFYLGSNSAKATAFEFDDNDFDQTESLQLTFGHQCNQSNGLWQIDNGTRSWVNTTIACSLSYSAWHTLVTNGHRILGDTSCGGKPTLYFDSIVIDGVTDQIDQTLCATALPGGTTAALLTQFQIDVGSTTAAQTVTVNLDNVNFTATNGFLTLVQNLLTGKPIGFRGGWVR